MKELISRSMQKLNVRKKSDNGLCISPYQVHQLHTFHFGLLCIFMPEHFVAQWVGIYVMLKVAVVFFLV